MHANAAQRISHDVTAFRARTMYKYMYSTLINTAHPLTKTRDVDHIDMAEGRSGYNNINNDKEECMDFSLEGPPSDTAASIDTQGQSNGAGAGNFSQANSRKRSRTVEGERTEVEKRGCGEGMSWWTCLMLGISQENSRQQVVKRVNDQREN